MADQLRTLLEEGTKREYKVPVSKNISFHLNINEMFPGRCVPWTVRPMGRSIRPQYFQQMDETSPTFLGHFVRLKMYIFSMKKHFL
jgi:hypothetical protein